MNARRPTSGKAFREKGVQESSVRLAECRVQCSDFKKRPVHRRPTAPGYRRAAAWPSTSPDGAVADFGGTSESDGRIGSMSPSGAESGRLGGDVRGTATVEYVVILVVLALGCALAMKALGVPLVAMFASERAWVLLPFP